MTTPKHPASRPAAKRVSTPPPHRACLKALSRFSKLPRPASGVEPRLVLAWPSYCLQQLDQGKNPGVPRGPRLSWAGVALYGRSRGLAGCFGV